MQTQQYTLTNRFMGDPRPDRFEVSERLHAKQKVRRAAETQMARDGASKLLRIDIVLSSVSEGHVTSRKISDHTGWRLGTVLDYLRRLVVGGSLTYHEVTSPTAQGGVVRVYEITDAGRKRLAEAVK